MDDMHKSKDIHGTSAQILCMVDGIVPGGMAKSDDRYREVGFAH